MEVLIIYRKQQVDFKWIKGHNNHPQNDVAMNWLLSMQNTFQ
jgi:ribonuclease HI